MKKLAITFSSVTEETLAKIKEIAKEYEVVQLKSSDEEIKTCDIIFGGIKSEFLTDATNLKRLHTSFAGVDALLKPEVNFPKDVILTNSAGTYGIAISEYLLTTTLMLMRRNIQYAKLQFQNKWEPLG